MTGSDELAARVRAVIAETFELEPASLPAEPDVESIEKWDSLGHMQLIEALEVAFGLEVAHADAVQLLSQSAIVEHLRGRMRT